MDYFFIGVGLIIFGLIIFLDVSLVRLLFSALIIYIGIRCMKAGSISLVKKPSYQHDTQKTIVFNYMVHSTHKEDSEFLAQEYTTLLSSYSIDLRHAHNEDVFYITNICSLITVLIPENYKVKTIIRSTFASIELPKKNSYQKSEKYKDELTLIISSFGGSIHIKESL